SFGTRRSWVQIPPTRPRGLGRLVRRSTTNPRL
ncbi:uncharacterized protein METZ01_LOCUS355510, partial [marine metagenome]